MWEVSDEQQEQEQQQQRQLEKQLQQTSISNESGKPPPHRKHSNDASRAAAAAASSSADQSANRKNFLDGFRTSLVRPRTRSDDFGDEKGHFRPEGLSTILQNVVEQKRNGQQQGGSGGGRRWSESGSPGEAVAVGTTVRVLVDYRPVREDEVGVVKGQMVRVAATDPDRGAYRVCCASGAEGWVPSYVLTLLSSGGGGGGGQRKGTSSSSSSSSAWNIRSKFRRPSFGRKDSRTEFSVSVAAARRGETAVLKCARAPGAVVSVRWSRVVAERGSLALSPSPKYSHEHDEHQGVVVMYVANCEDADAGEYHCVQQGGGGQEVVSVIHLKIRGKKRFTVL